VRTEFFRTLADAVKEKSEALRIAEAIRIAEAMARAIAVDISKPRISAGNKRRSADIRARVDEVVKSCRRKNLFFSTEVERHVAEADIVCVSVNMPTNTEAGAADVNEELEVPAKVKREEM
jgi:UDP-glucose 6-dehydrogenase